MKPSSSPYPIVIPAPFGAVGVRVEKNHVTEIALVSAALLSNEAVQPLNETVEVAKQIQAYLSNPHAYFNFSHLVSGTSFQKRVWQAIAEIPLGQTLTYTELAAKVSSGARAVANACGANKLPLLIPCHRVVAKNGLGGFMQSAQGGLVVKAWLLKHESQ